MSEIKDSGSTREFSTGAHRDNATGKGRCDLLPLMEVGVLTGDMVITELALFFEDKDETHIYSALKNSLDTVKEYEGNFSTMLIEASKLYEDGARKYGENNWRKGMPLKCYLDSGIRHYLKTLRGDNDEPHYRGFVWNMLCALWTIHNVPNALDELIVKE